MPRMRSRESAPASRVGGVPGGSVHQLGDGARDQGEPYDGDRGDVPAGGARVPDVRGEEPDRGGQEYEGGQGPDRAHEPSTGRDVTVGYRRLGSVGYPADDGV
jgi:hypothetical protein